MERGTIGYCNRRKHAIVNFKDLLPPDLIVNKHATFVSVYHSVVLLVMKQVSLPDNTFLHPIYVPTHLMIKEKYCGC